MIYLDYYGPIIRANASINIESLENNFCMLKRTKSTKFIPYMAGEYVYRGMPNVFLNKDIKRKHSDLEILNSLNEFRIKYKEELEFISGLTKGIKIAYERIELRMPSIYTFLTLDVDKREKAWEYNFNFQARKEGVKVEEKTDEITRK